MLPPQVIFGVITGAYGLVKDIYDWTSAVWSANETAKELKFKLDSDKLILEIFLAFFKEKEVFIAENLAVSIHLLSHEMHKNLQDTTAKLRLEKGKLSVFGKLDWPRVKNAIIKAEWCLRSWAHQLQLMVGLLPDDLTSSIHIMTTSDKYKALIDPLLALKLHIDMTRVKADSDKNTRDELVKQIGSRPEDNAERDNVIQRRYIHEEIHIPMEDLVSADRVKSFIAKIAKLANVLKLADPKHTNIPKLKDWYQPLPGDSLFLAYEVPSSVSGYKDTLNALVVKQQPATHDLSNRIILARDLASAVTFVHGLGWVHKQINSWTTRIFSFGEEGEVGRLNLIGFDIARPVSGMSTNAIEENKLYWKRQTYCHPARQIWSMRNDDGGSDTQEEDHDQAQEASLSLNVFDQQVVKANTGLAQGSHIAAQNKLPYYRNKHDVYSMGVVLLEIGLWESLTSNYQSPLRTAKPAMRKEILLRMVSKILISRMGGRYTNLTKDCLNVDDTKIEAHQVLARLSEIKM